MTPDLRKQITDRYTTWSETWGLSMAFAVTQSVEKAERIVADVIVALIAQDAARPDSAPKSASASAQRFATALWEQTNQQAYRGFGADSFFRMPAVARAIVILKTRAQFSRHQISQIVGMTPEQIDDHLENARLLFSDGRPWIQASPDINVQGDRWVPECPQWKATAPRSDEPGQAIQDVFARYVGNDLDLETGQKLHSHLIVCTVCRTSFAHFKRQYTDWVGSIPTIEADLELKKHLTKVTKMAFRVRAPGKGAPSPLPGIRRILRDGQVRAMVFGALAVMFAQIFFHKHPLLLPRFLRKFF